MCLCVRYACMLVLMCMCMCMCMWVLYVHVHSLVCVCAYAALAHMLVLMCMRMRTYVLPRHVTNARIVQYLCHHTHTYTYTCMYVFMYVRFHHTCPPLFSCCVLAARAAAHVREPRSAVADAVRLRGRGVASRQMWHTSRSPSGGACAMLPARAAAVTRPAACSASLSAVTPT